MRAAIIYNIYVRSSSTNPINGYDNNNIKVLCNISIFIMYGRRSPQ